MFNWLNLAFLKEGENLLWLWGIKLCFWQFLNRVWSMPELRLQQLSRGHLLMQPLLLIDCNLKLSYPFFMILFVVFNQLFIPRSYLFILFIIMVSYCCDILEITFFMLFHKKIKSWGIFKIYAFYKLFLKLLTLGLYQILFCFSLFWIDWLLPFEKLPIQLIFHIDFFKIIFNSYYFLW